MHLKKEDVKVKCFKTMLENGKKFITQANEALLKMKLTKAGIVLTRPEADDFGPEETFQDPQSLLRGLLGAFQY